MSSRVLQAFKQHRFSLPWLLFRKALAPFVTLETLVLYRHDLNQVAVRAAPGLEVARIADATALPFQKLCAKYPDKNFAERFALPGRDCYVGLKEGDVAGYAWVSVDSLYVDEIACTYPLAAGEVFIYDCFVDDQFRGQGIYPAMLGAALEDCSRRSDVQTAVIGAASVNHASMRGIAKAGFTEWKRIHYVEWGTRQRWWGLDPCGSAA